MIEPRGSTTRSNNFRGIMQNKLTLLQRWEKGDPDILNIAAFCPATEALGPGKRAVIWVQGCSFRCPGCVSPSYRPFTPAALIEAGDLTARILQIANLDGITISGGEPLHQAMGLVKLIDGIKEHRPDLTFLSYTGFRLEDLLQMPGFPGASEYLARLDCLIDGPYIRSLDDGLTGLKGSRNQTVHHFTPRLKDFPFEDVIRQPEIRIQDHELLFIGIPTRRLTETLDDAMRMVRNTDHKLVQDVRA